MDNAHLLAVLAGWRTDLEAMLADNAAASVDRTGRRILDGLDEQASKFIRVIARQERSPTEGPYGSLGHVGLYGGEAAIRDTIRRSEWHRRNGKQERKAA